MLRSRRSYTVLALVAAVPCAVLVACSGAKDSDLLFPGESSTFGAEPKQGTSSSGSTSGGSSGSTSGGSSGSTSGGSSGSTSGGSSGSTSGGSSSGSSGTSSSGSSGWFDAGGPHTIKCGKQASGADRTCTSPDVCCATKSGGGGGTIKYECAGAFGCNSGTPISCASSADCNFGNVCCGTFDTNIGYQRVACTPESACGTSPVPNVQLLRFCDKSAPVDECAAIGKTCQPSSSLPGFYRCN